MAVLSADQVAGYAYNAGFRGDALAVAVAVAHAESGFDTGIVRTNSGPGIAAGYQGSRDRGLWQINDRAHPEVTDAEALAPSTAAAATYRISSGGSSWSAWATYKGGQYAQYMSEARSAGQAVERRGGNPDTPSTPPSANTPATTRDPAPLNPRGAEGIGPADAIDFIPPAIAIRGKMITGGASGLDDLLVGTPTLELSATQVSDTTLTFHDPELRRLSEGDFDIGNTVDIHDLTLVVAALETQPSQGGPQVVLTCRPDGIEKLRQKAAPTSSGVSAGDYVSGLFEDVGIRPGVIALGAPRATIAPQQKDAGDTAASSDATGKRLENAWEVAARLAQEEGVWLFESAGVGYFERPSELINRTVEFWVYYRDNDYPIPTAAPPFGPGEGFHEADFAAVELPNCRNSQDNESLAKTVTVKLPANRGVRVRPGMRLNLMGVPAFVDSYIVTKVAYGLGWARPVTIEAAAPIDPTPTLTTASAGGPGQPSSQRTASGQPHKGSKSALDFVTYCLRQVGDTYQFGAEVALTDPDPSVFDCSELVQWALYQVGITFPDGSSNQRAAVIPIPVGDAAYVRGALLFHPGHVAVSLGDTVHTVEAMGRKYGVVEGLIGNRFSYAGLVPDLNYPSSESRPIPRPGTPV